MCPCHAPAPPDAHPLSAYGVAAGIEPKKNYQPTNQARVILIFSVSFDLFGTDPEDIFVILN